VSRTARARCVHLFSHSSLLSPRQIHESACDRPGKVGEAAPSRGAPSAAAAWPAVELQAQVSRYVVRGDRQEIGRSHAHDLRDKGVFL
jgi:hypothetical protein